MEFKVGDIIKGKKDNGYDFTNENMTKAKVIETNKECMKIEIIEHKNTCNITSIYAVDNSSDRFEIVEYQKPTKKELLAMPAGTKITTDAEAENAVFVFNGCSFRNKERGEAIFDGEIDENLILNAGPVRTYGSKIIKIEKPQYTTIYEEMQKEIKEMTIAEIEKKLGYPVKIVKEEQE